MCASSYERDTCNKRCIKSRASLRNFINENVEKVFRVINHDLDIYCPLANLVIIFPQKMYKPNADEK